MAPGARCVLAVLNPGNLPSRANILCPLFSPPPVQEYDKAMATYGCFKLLRLILAMRNCALRCAPQEYDKAMATYEAGLGYDLGPPHPPKLQTFCLCPLLCHTGVRQGHGHLRGGLGYDWDPPAPPNYRHYVCACHCALRRSTTRPWPPTRRGWRTTPRARSFGRG